MHNRQAQKHKNIASFNFEMMECDGLLGKFKCKDCGTIFYMHPDATEYGSPCPACSRNMSRVQIYKRYADFLDDDEYDVYEDDGRIHVIHKECGNNVPLRFPLNVWRRTKCRTCWRNERHKEHVGEQNINTCGKLMTITDYRSSDNVEVLFEDGSTCDTNYDCFLKGWVKSGTDLPLEAQRVGEKRVNTQGLEMEICRYKGTKDLDVIFKNGVVSWRLRSNQMQKPNDNIGRNGAGYDRIKYK